MARLPGLQDPETAGEVVAELNAVEKTVLEIIRVPLAAEDNDCQGTGAERSLAHKLEGEEAGQNFRLVHLGGEVVEVHWVRSIVNQGVGLLFDTIWEAAVADQIPDHHHKLVLRRETPCSFLGLVDAAVGDPARAILNASTNGDYRRTMWTLDGCDCDRAWGRTQKKILGDVLVI